MILLFIFLCGLFIGSFLGVVIDRLPQNKSIIKGRSYCDKCKHNLGFFDLFPVLSFILLRGKCRYCKAKLFYFYPVIELITAFLFAFTYIAVTSPLTLINYKFIIYLSYLLLTVSSFIVIFFIDLQKGIIPDNILIFDTVLTLVWLLFNPLTVIINHLLSAFGSISFFLIITYGFYFLTKKDGMGGGDIKLSFVLGLILGFPAVVISLYLAFVVGAFVSIMLLIFKLKKISGSLAFGPFLIIGAFLSLFFQNQMQDVFLKILGF